MFSKVVLDKLVLEEISFQIVTEGIYKKCVAPKRKVWPKFPITLGSLRIPTSTWASDLSDHIVSLNLGFSSKRKHDPKGIVAFHLKHNHLKHDMFMKKLQMTSSIRELILFVKAW